MPIPILMYHQVDRVPARGTPLRGMVVGPGAFARQMALLARLGYRGLAMRDLLPYLDGSVRGRVVGITFDDGYLNTLEQALPILRRHRFGATCYALSALLGDFNRWDDAKGVPRQPLMNAAQWRVWIDAGMEVGAHGRHHLDLTELDAAAARAEIGGARTELESLLQVPVQHFCYPYGRFLEPQRALVEAAGYRTAVTVRRGRAMPGGDRFALPRVLVARSTHLGHFVLKLLTRYEDRRG
jgi:peptidoglycan/xylan/chitin deacetylase (PgdA/CDA1 family)